MAAASDDVVVRLMIMPGVSVFVVLDTRVKQTATSNEKKK